MDENALDALLDAALPVGWHDGPVNKVERIIRCPFPDHDDVHQVLVSDGRSGDHPILLDHGVAHLVWTRRMAGALLDLGLRSLRERRSNLILAGQKKSETEAKAWK